MGIDKKGHFILFNHNEAPEEIVATIKSNENIMVCCIQNIPGILEHIKDIPGWGIFFDDTMGPYYIMWNKKHLYIDPVGQEKTIVIDNPPKNTLFSISVFLHSEHDVKQKYVITLLYCVDQYITDSLLFEYLANVEGLRYQNNLMASHYIFNNLKKDFDTLSYFEVESYYPIALFPHEQTILSDME